MTSAQTSLSEKCARFGDSSGGHISRRSAPRERECPRDVRVKAATGPEIRSVGSRDRCETPPDSPFPSGYDLWPPQAERPPDECGCCPSARIPAPAKRAAILAATQAGCRPLHPEKVCLYRPVRNVRSFARWLQ